MIVSEVQASVGPAGMTPANFSPGGGGIAAATIPSAAATNPPVLASVPLRASDSPSASHILAQFELSGWSAGAKDDDAEDQQIGIDASHENENPKRTSPSGLAAKEAKAGSIGTRLLPFGWLFSFLLEAARSCWIRIVPAASWLWMAITTTTATASSVSAAGNSAAAVPAHQHLKPLPTLHHLTVHESRNPLLPPGLMYLATLTLFALIIHPDGYTWVVLRRIREFVALTLRATAALWSLVLEDYGAVISSILALATFAALFFLAYVLRKTLTPKPNPGANNKQAQVVRKKRRGRGNHYHNSVHHGRRGQHQRGVGGRAQSHAAEDSSASRDETGTSSLSTNALPALLEGVPLSPPPLQSTGRPTTAADDESIKAGSGHSASSVGAASTKVSSRERIMTEDTDDLSYDSVSGRSTPTMAVDLSSQHSAASSAGNLAASPVPHRQPSRRDAAIPRTMSVPTPAPKQGARKEAAVGGGRRKKAEPAPLSRVNNPPPASVKSSRTSATAGSSAMPNSQSVAGLVQTQGRWESLKPRGKGQQHHQLPSQPQPQPQPQSRQPRSRQVLTMQVQQPRVVASKQPRTPDNDKARSPKLASRDAATSGSTPSTKKSKNPATTTPSQTPPAATAASRGAQLVVNTAQPSPTPTVFYSPAREGAGTPGLGESNTTPFGTPMSFSSTTQQSSFFSTSAWDLKAAPSSSSYGPWAATDAATETTKPSRNQELQGMALDLGIGLGEITLGAPATSAFGHPASPFASIRPPPGLSLPPSLAANQCQEPSLSSVLPGLTASVPAVDDPVSTVLFPVSARAPGAPSAYSPRRRVRENPFEDETTGRDDDNNGDDDLMIEAELKELGGRIAGSVLDF